MPLCDNCGQEQKYLLNVKWKSENDNLDHIGYFCRPCALGILIFRSDTEK